MRVLALFLAMLVAGCGGGNGGKDKDGGADGPAGQHDGPLQNDGPLQGDTLKQEDVGAVITPDDPGASDVAFDVNSGADVHAISPYIYGTNMPDWGGKTAHLTATRLGGNRWTAFNWENNASNAGSDWNFQNDNYLGGGDTPGESVRAPVAAAHTAGASMLVTIPIVGYVAADKNGDGDVRNSGSSYLQTRFKVSRPLKGAAFADPPDTTDGYVNQDEFVSWLEGKFPGARTDAARTILYSLDNEPDLWSGTHAEVYPSAVTYADLRQRSIDYASAIKSVAPGALVFGPVSYGFNGYVNLQNASDAGGRDFLEYYLDEMKKAGDSAGKRLLDVLDLHWYSEAQGSGTRVVNCDTSAAVQDARIQAPRSLWDPTYSESSWVQQYLGEPIKLIPRLKDKIAAKNPDTKIGFTEYSHGCGADISDGIAEADVLGIFGREGVFFATVWEMGSTTQSFLYGALAAYRSYDGAGAAFGDTSIHGQTADVARTSVYASVDQGAPGRMVLVAINKHTAALTAGVKVTHTVRFNKAEVYQITASSPTPAHQTDVSISLTNAFTYSMPARSVTVLVLKP